jgi:protein involved in polysaccharide export with SLBB domain
MLHAMQTSRAALAAAALIVFGAGTAAAQQPADSTAGGVQVTRQALEELLRQLQQSAQSSAYSSSLRARSRFEASLMAERLEQGDFQVGDRINLSVDNEPTLSDTFTVAPGRVINLPGVGSIPLSGVLRSELTDYLTRRIGQFVRNPVVHTKSLIRVSVLGGVGKPGYYTVPTQALVSDVLMQAGGPVPSAKLLNTRIERGKETLWGGEQLQQAIAQGRTLDGLSLQAGDRIVVPEKGDAQSTQYRIQLISVLISLPVAIFGLIKLFKL